MQSLKRRSSLILMLLLSTACVTINVYFPAAAAENAADRLIKEVYGLEKAGPEDAPAVEPATDPDQKSGALLQTESYLAVLLNFLVTPVYAQQPDINISSPAINTLKASMTDRHRTLSPFYDSGAVGMDSNGLIDLRDARLIDLKQRNAVKKLVNDENRDRNALYAEIARANGHPEWEAEIRNTFARRWVANAPAGWWYQTADGWTQTR